MRSLTLVPLQALLVGSTAVPDHAQSPLAYSSRKCIALPGTRRDVDMRKAIGKGAGAWTDAYTQARQLVGQMTLEEKVNITRGFPSTDNICAGNTGTVPRLNWPGLCVHDAGNGVRAADLVTSFPSALHVGASWDKNLTYQRGLFMGKEFKAKGSTTSIFLMLKSRW
jgi:beta-glucosidase-like glycosyl hydrolase